MKNNSQLTNLLNEFTTFRKEVFLYENLLHESRDDMADIVMNHDEIAEKRSDLTKAYANLEKFIKIFGQNPKYHDGVWPVYLAVYETAFSSDILQRVGPCIDSVLQDLDYIIGKLENIKEDEFNTAVNPKPQTEREKNNNSKVNFWQHTNPAWLFWQFGKIIWKHKIISVCIVLVSLIAVDYSLAWRNIQWVINYFNGFLK